LIAHLIAALGDFAEHGGRREWALRCARGRRFGGGRVNTENQVQDRELEAVVGEEDALIRRNPPALQQRAVGAAQVTQGQLSVLNLEHGVKLRNEVVLEQQVVQCVAANTYRQPRKYAIEHLVVL
jgi:hypothetical protein